jgi:light-regulated signal transduction histidine kinase (bacteriophytochrome)
LPAKTLPMHFDPAFGQADLTNCEREPIHLAGSVQPHGLLLVLRETDLVVVQASRNAATMLGVPADGLTGQVLARVGGDAVERVRHLVQHAELLAPAPLRLTTGPAAAPRRFEGALHRLPGGALVLELEPLDDAVDAALGIAPGLDVPPARLQGTLAAAVQRISAAPSIGVLADALAQVVRDLTGYDRVMVYRFDPDGHGMVIAEARDARLAPLLGHHYPASDIPQRARSLYLKSRVRMLADVDAPAQPLVPAMLPLTGGPLDMSLCHLRSMSPIHLQYLRNMGVTASMSVSLVREGQLWGLVAAHHHAPRRLRRSLRTAAELLGEVASTRITAIENYAHAQVALMVRRLEQRLVEATSAEGDWRYALFRNPRTLLQPLEATGVALFHDDELLTAGEVPSTPELRALLDWVRAQPVAGTGDEPIATSTLGTSHPELRSLTPTASGVLAVRLSASRPDYLIWLRKEQLLTVTWAGDPAKPMVGDNPLQLSPRRSFAAWSEIVRGTAMPWSTSELALARAIGIALVDISVQVQAVRLLIAERQLADIRASMTDAREPVLVCDAAGVVIFSNDALRRLLPRAIAPGTALAALFVQGGQVGAALGRLRESPQPWRHELELAGEPPLPVAVRAEVVTGRRGEPLGYVVVLGDMRETRRADAARLHLEEALRGAATGTLRESDDVVSAILTNASLAAMDIADARGGPPIAPLLEEVEAAARRAAALYAQIREHG